jgi:phosphate:Na+ symporter
MRNEYNGIRVNIAHILRMIDRLQHGSDDVDVFDLDELKLNAKEDRNATIRKLDKMIRRGQITGTMATSLMNDLFFSKSIIRDLTRAGHILFSDRNLESRKAEDIVALDDEDIRDLAESSDL